MACKHRPQSRLHTFQLAHREAREQGRAAQQAIIKDRWFEATPQFHSHVRIAKKHLENAVATGKKEGLTDKIPIAATGVGIDFAKASIPLKVENPETEVPQLEIKVVKKDGTLVKSRRLEIKVVKKDGTLDKRCKLNTLRVESDQVASQAPSSGKVVVLVSKAGPESRRLKVKGIKKDGTLDKRFTLRKKAKEEELKKQLGHMSAEEQLKHLSWMIRGSKITKSLVIRYVKSIEKESEKKGNPEELAKVDYKAWLKHLTGQWFAARYHPMDSI